MPKSELPLLSKVSMPNRLALVAFLTDDYDRAITWFRDALRFVLLEDTDMGSDKRWVRMAPHKDAETAFLIARAVGAQAQAIGNQAGGRVGHFLVTDNFADMHAHMLSHGVHFRETPRHETYGVVAVFEDLHGNPWDLIEHNNPT